MTEKTAETILSENSDLLILFATLWGKEYAEMAKNFTMHDEMGKYKGSVLKELLAKWISEYLSAGNTLSAEEFFDFKIYLMSNLCYLKDASGKSEIPEDVAKQVESYMKDNNMIFVESWYPDKEAFYKERMEIFHQTTEKADSLLNDKSQYYQIIPEFGVLKYFGGFA